MADPVLGPTEEGDTFRVTFFQRLDNQQVLNVLHYSVVDPTITPPDRYTLSALLAQEMVVDPGGIAREIAAMQSNSVLWEAVRVQFLKEVTASYPYYQLAVAFAGERLGDVVAPNLALSLEKRAQTAPTTPRQGIGRIQIAGPPPNVMVNGLFTAPYIADAANLCDELAENITLAIGVELQPVLSRPGLTNWLDSPIFDVIPHNTIRTMSRRTVGRGV